MRVPISGGTPSMVADGQDNPVGIVADEENVYWTTRSAVMKLAKP